MNTDFVDFDLAKKLKEKGYPQRTFGKYTMLDACYIEDGRFYENGCITEVERAYTSPTISQVLKWLREDKRIHIIIEISNSGWSYSIYPNIRWENDKLKSDYISSFEHKESYEQAVFAGIEYVLNNLKRL